MNQVVVGYQALIERFQLNPIPHYRVSYIRLKGRPKTVLHNNVEVHEYFKSYALERPDDPFSQLEFALKYDGINLEILRLVFQSYNPKNYT